MKNNNEDLYQELDKDDKLKDEIEFCKDLIQNKKIKIIHKDKFKDKDEDEDDALLIIKPYWCELYFHIKDSKYEDPYIDKVELNNENDERLLNNTLHFKSEINFRRNRVDICHGNKEKGKYVSILIKFGCILGDDKVLRQSGIANKIIEKCENEKININDIRYKLVKNKESKNNVCRCPRVGLGQRDDKNNIRKAKLSFYNEEKMNTIIEILN